MTDDQWNQQANQTSTAIEDHNNTVEDTRQKLVNDYAQKKGVIEDTEDFMNEYRNQGFRQMQAVEDYLKGNRRDWEEAQKAIDAIADVEGSNNISRRQFAGLAATTGAAAVGGAFLGGLWPFGGGSTEDKGPVYVDRNGFQQAYDELSESEQLSVFSDSVYEEMFDGDDRDIVAGYFDHNPSDDKTDSSFKYFFAENVDDYMTKNDQGKEVFDYSQLDSDELRMGSVSWQNTDDSIAETFEKYGTRNTEQIPDLLEGGLK